jgi:hypothetical protein
VKTKNVPIDKALYSRVKTETPKTSSELTPKEKRKFKREKTSSKRISYQHKKKKKKS